MDSNRSAKRRKLDTPNGNARKGSGPSKSRSTPITYSKKQSSAHKESAHGTSTAASSAEQPSLSYLDWQEAKANIRAQRGKRKSNNDKKEDVNIYDDIEGAHEVRPPGKIQSESTPKKKHLDPLRNQKAAESPTSSPAKSRSPLNFFKKFAQPKALSQETAPSTDVSPHGLSKNGTASLDQDAVAGAQTEQESKESDGEDAAPEIPAKPAWKGWAYQKGPKKTLEDEIRELAEQAEKDENDGSADTASSSRRKRIRTSKLETSEDMPRSPAQQRSVKSETAKPNGLVSKLKQARKDARQPAASDNLEAQDVMDIDEPDDIQVDQLNETSGVTDRLQKKDIIEAMPLKRSKIALSSTAIFSAEHLEQIQSILLQKLTRRRRTQISNLDTEYNKVSTLITQTVTSGESNSMLLIGARGSGKSALLEQILHEQAQKSADEFHVVRLNGFIHTDDKIALGEIWRQLGREMELDGDDSTSKNYADTLTTLLALLSHPAELGQEQQEGQITKSVIFIIDEFDLFANHPRQTLLYNLFDIAQSRKAPIAVLGLTTRIDVAESLEKRVKSRFSHRYVHLSFAKSFSTFQDSCRASIGLNFDELSIEERESFGAKTGVTQKLEKESKKKRSGSVIENWNNFIDDLLEDNIFQTHLRRIYYTTKSIPEFQSCMLLPVSSLPTESPATGADLLLHFTDIVSTLSLSPPDSNLTLLHSLSTVHLALLICAARLTNIHATDVVPFAQAYEEYKVLASKQKLQASASGALAQGAGSRVWSKDVAKAAWEDLISFGLVIEDGSRGVRVDVGLEEIGMAGVELGSWGRWCREI